jgi:hypothetical protein
MLDAVSKDDSVGCEGSALALSSARAKPAILLEYAFAIKARVVFSLERRTILS